MSVPREVWAVFAQLLTVDEASHLAAAIHQHQVRKGVDGGVPRALSDIRAEVHRRASGGQPGPTFDASGEGPESEVMPLLLTYEQAADRLGLGVRTVKRHVSTGALEPTRLGRSVKFRTEELDAFIERQTNRSRPC